MSIFKLFFLSQNPRPAATNQNGGQLVLQPAGVSITLGSEWTTFPLNLQQRDTDAQICTPGIMRRDGAQVCALLMPTSAETFDLQVEEFIKSQAVDVLNRKLIENEHGQMVHIVVGTKSLPQSDKKIAIAYCLTKNSAGRFVALWSLGAPATVEDFLKWCPPSLRNVDSR